MLMISRKILYTLIRQLNFNIKFITVTYNNILQCIIKIVVNTLSHTIPYVITATSI